jgi:hypothetical protein
MKGLINGEIRELTKEDIEELKLNSNQVLETITDKQRISALESAIADLAIMLTGGVDNE